MASTEMPSTAAEISGAGKVEAGSGVSQKVGDATGGAATDAAVLGPKEDKKDLQNKTGEGPNGPALSQGATPQHYQPKNHNANQPKLYHYGNANGAAGNAGARFSGYPGR
ncbi:hypothetical protein HK101_006813, partial [Irineochytrium annulatum]